MSPEQPYDDEDMPDSIELTVKEGCTCELCQMGVEVEQVDKDSFMAFCWDAPGLYGWGEFEEEAVEELLDFIFAIRWN